MSQANLITQVLTRPVLFFVLFSVFINWAFYARPMVVPHFISSSLLTGWASRATGWKHWDLGAWCRCLFNQLSDLVISTLVFKMAPPSSHCLCLCLPLYLLLCLCLCLYVSVRSLSLSISLCPCLSLSLSISCSVNSFVCFCLYLTVTVCFCLPACPSASTSLFVCLYLPTPLSLSLTLFLPLSFSFFSLSFVKSICIVLRFHDGFSLETIHHLNVRPGWQIVNNCVVNLCCLRTSPKILMPLKHTSKFVFYAFPSFQNVSVPKL